MRCVLFGLLLASSTAYANGQSTHLWITDHALEHLPDGPLRDLLTREDVRPMLENGTMFPDGGYAVNEDYGEIAHWEPFHDAYLTWITEQDAAPWTDASAQHIAFLMGMASHGMADQIFDSLFMERSKRYDHWQDLYNLDTASDLLYTSEFGGRTPAEDWVPYTLMVSLFKDQTGHTVDADTLAQGQSLLRFAIDAVGAIKDNTEVVSGYAEEYDWSSAHLFDASVPGSPACEAAVIARYWQVIWNRLLGEGWESESPLATWPTDGATHHPEDADQVEARVTIAFPRGLQANVVDPSAFTVTDPTGTPHPIELWHFYGHGSHVVHLLPTAPWHPNTDYSVHVESGIIGLDGGKTEEAISFGFSTKTPEPEAPSPCGCASSRTPWSSACLFLGSVLLFRRLQPRVLS